VEHINCYVSYVRNRKWGHQEWVKSDRNALASRANQSWLKLAVKQVANDWFISVEVLVPSVKTCLLVSLSFSIWMLDVRLLSLLIEIFRHEVQNGVDALLRIVLAVTFKCDIVLTQNSLEEIWTHNIWLTTPHLTYQFCPCLNNSALSSKRILVLATNQRLVLPLQEVASQLISIWQALNTAIHVAGVSKVWETHQSLSWILTHRAVVVLLQLSVSLGTALVNMESPVLLQAVIIAVLDILAFTNWSHDVLFIAIFACTD